MFTGTYLNHNSGIKVVIENDLYVIYDIILDPSMNVNLHFFKIFINLFIVM